MFDQVYDTPPKIILQVYVALLRTFQPDARALVKRALDILTPALPTRLPAGDHKYPTWIKWTKKIVVEEGHSLPQLIHIWQLVVRYLSIYIYPSVAFFLYIDIYPTLIKWTKKVVVKEGHSLPQLIHIWQLVVIYLTIYIYVCIYI